MVNEVTLVTLLALATVTFAVRTPAKFASIEQRMMDTSPVLYFPGFPEGCDAYTANTTCHTFRTRIDHFNPQNRATFELKYYSNDQYYKPGGPIFIFVGGSWRGFSSYIERGHFHNLAYYEHAWLFSNEHRYYGYSTPTEDHSIENLRWLTTEQALVDLAEWIFHLRHNVVRDANARVILMGYGYAGNLATWMRQRYPHLIEGALVINGQVEARLNFKEYAMSFGEVIRSRGSNECYSQIWRGFRTAENLIDAGMASTVTDLFNLCKPLDAESTLEVETFFFNIMETLQNTMLSYDLNTVDRICEQFDNSTEATDLQTLANWVNYYSYDCLPWDFTTKTEAFLYITVDHPYGVLRQRLYQECTEFGWFFTADSPDQPFGSRVTTNFFFNLCKAAFGDWLDAQVINDGVHLTNMHFGGQNPRISNVLFVSGELHPARDVFITEYYQAGSAAVVIPDKIGDEVLESISGYDSPELLEAKHTIHQFVKSWLWEPIVPV